VEVRPCKDQTPQAEASATIAAAAQRGAARNLVVPVRCGEPKVAAEQAAAPPLAEAPRWQDSDVEWARARVPECAVIHSPPQLHS